MSEPVGNSRQHPHPHITPSFPWFAPVPPQQPDLVWVFLKVGPNTDRLQDTGRLQVDYLGEIIQEREKQKGEESTERTKWVCVLSWPRQRIKKQRTSLYRQRSV